MEDKIMGTLLFIFLICGIATARPREFEFFVFYLMFATIVLTMYGLIGGIALSL
jgi:hypothetical protein